MKVICAPKGIANKERPSQGIADIKRAGFECAMLDTTVFCEYGSLKYKDKAYPGGKRPPKTPVAEQPELMGEYLLPFIDACRKNEIKIPLALAPLPEPDTKRTDLNTTLLELAKETIKTAGAAGCEGVIVPPIYIGVNFSNAWEVNKDFYRRLASVGAESGVKILLMNLVRNVDGHLCRGIGYDSVTMAEWIDELNKEAGEDRFAFCLDTMASTIGGVQLHEYITDMGKRLSAVLVRDCDGYNEGSFLPFSQRNAGGHQTDWLSLFRGLRAIGFDGNLVVEAGDTAKGFSPIIKPSLMALIKATADYIAWQIDLENMIQRTKRVVLFGAGNMCRAYMKNYGSLRPPLFTCDNNSKLWGTEFEGLSVHDPKDLKNLEEDVTIFICNTYYREIDAQLKEMGVTNPILYFNDEYMPSFHTDRIDAETRKIL